MEKKTIKLANGSELIYKCGTAYCYLPIFYINGIVAKEWDFGNHEDIASEEAAPYCCGNMQFLPHECRQEILEKYSITEEEYNQICKELDCLSFGCCGWCE